MSAQVRSSADCGREGRFVALIWSVMSVSGLRCGGWYRAAYRMTGSLCRALAFPGLRAIGGGLFHPLAARRHLFVSVALCLTGLLRAWSRTGRGFASSISAAFWFVSVRVHGAIFAASRATLIIGNSKK